MKRELMTLVYVGLALGSVSTSIWRLSRPVTAAAASCSSIVCWSTAGGYAWYCTDGNKACTYGCGGVYCNNNVQ